MKDKDNQTLISINSIVGGVPIHITTYATEREEELMSELMEKNPKMEMGDALEEARKLAAAERSTGNTTRKS